MRDFDNFKTVAKVTFLLGLCGSGKTYYAERLKEVNAEAEIFQDLLHQKAVPRLLQRLTNGIDCIVEEFRFCFPNERSDIIRVLSSIAGITSVRTLVEQIQLIS